MTEALMANKVEKEVAEAAVANVGLSTSQKIATATTGKLSAAIAGLKAVITPTSLIIAGVVAAVGAFAAIWDATHTSLKEAKSTISDLQSEYEDGINTLKDINNELTNINDKITDILSQDKISLADKEDLALLKQERSELEKQLALQEKLNQAKASQVITELSTNFDKLDGGFNIDLSRYNEAKKYFEEQKNLQLDSVKQGTLSLEYYDKNMLYLEGEVADKYQDLFASIEEYESYHQSLLNKYNGNVENMSRGDKRLFDSISNALNDAYRSIYSESEYYQLVIEPVFNTEQLDGLNEKIIEYFENDGVIDVKALEQKFGTEIINALKAACETAGIEFPELLNDLFNQANVYKPVEKQLLRSRLGAGDLMRYISQLRNMTSDDLRNIDFTDGVTAQEYAFKDLLSVLGYTKENAEIVIAVLEELGYILSTPIDTENGITSAFSISEEDAKKLSEYQSKIDSISKSLGNLHNLEAGDISKIMQEFSGEEFGAIFEKWGVDGTAGTGNLKAALEEIAIKLRDTATTAVPQMTKAINEMYEIIMNPKGAFDKFSSEIEELEAVLEKVRNGENIDNVDNLINKYGDLADSVVITADGYSIEEDALIDLINARITNLNSIISYESEATKKTLASIRSRIEAYGLEAEHIAAITEIWKQTGSENAILDYTNRVLGSSVSIDPELLSTYVAYSLELEDLLNKIRDLHDKGDSEDSKSNTIDWMTTSLANAQEKVDDLNRSFENAKGIKAQKKAISELNTELGNLRKAYVFAADEYNTRYKNALYSLNEHGYDPQDIQKKIEAGFIFDTDSFPSEVADLINDAIDAWNGKRDADNKVIELGVDIDENSIKSLELDIDEASSLKDLAEAKLDNAISDENRLSIYKDLEGLIDNYYAKEIQLAELNKDSVEVENLKLQKEKELYELAQSRLELVRENSNFELEQIEQNRKAILAEVDLKGGKGSSQNYNDLIGFNDQEIQKRNEELEREFAILADIRTKLGENSAEYREQVSRVNDISNAISECEKNTKEWRISLLQLPLEEIESTIEDLSNKLDSAQKSMDDMNNIFAGAQAYIQDEIDEQEKLKDVIQDQIDSLQKANDERQRSIALQKAQYELERAHSQRSVKVYKADKGFVYEQSQESIRSAQENLDNQNYENAVHQLEKQLEYYDEIIEGLNEVKEQWASIASEAEDYFNIQKALNAIGENGIFNPEVIERYIESYKGLTKTVEDLTSSIDELEVFKENIQKIIDKYEYGFYNYEEAVEEITDTTSEFYEQSGLQGEAHAAAVEKTVEQIKKQFDLVGDSAEDSQDDIEETTNVLNTEAKKQKRIVQNLSKDISSDIDVLCVYIEERLTSTFKKLGSTITGIVHEIHDELTSVVGQAHSSISTLQNLASQAKSLNSSIVTSMNTTKNNISNGVQSGATATPNKNARFSKGGLITTYDKELDDVARSIGEDHITTIGYKEGERILTPEQSKLWEQMSNASFNSNNMFNVQPIKLPEVKKAGQNMVPVVQNVNLTLPNVTNDGGYNRVVQELKSLQLDALQHSSRK